jgi:ribonuclease HI
VRTSYYAAKVNFKAINNIVEYEGLILLLNKAIALGARQLLAKTESQVVPGHVKKDYIAREPETNQIPVNYKGHRTMVPWLHHKIHTKVQNSKADELANATQIIYPIPNHTFYQELTILYKNWAHIPKERITFDQQPNFIPSFGARNFGPTSLSFQAVDNCSPPLPSHFVLTTATGIPNLHGVSCSSHIPFKVYLEEILYLTCVFCGYRLVRVSCLIHIV